MPQSLYPLLLLACPIGMGLMMWAMMRRGMDSTPKNTAPSDSPAAHAEVARLREEIARLRTAQDNNSVALTKN